MNFWSYLKLIVWITVFIPVFAAWAANFLIFIDTLLDVFTEEECSFHSERDTLIYLGVWTVVWVLLFALVLWLGSFCLPLSWLTEK